MRTSCPTSRRRVASEIAVCALAALSLPRATAQTEPVFRSTSEVVLVPATVLDKQGHPVTGLKREQFELRVDAKPVRIEVVDEITESSTAIPAAPSLPADTVTNISPVETSRRSFIVLLVDFINTSAPARMELRKQLLKFLSKDLQPGREIAIYALSNSLVLLHPFTTDTKLLIEAASRLVREKGTPPLPNAGFLSATPASVAGSIAMSPGGVGTFAAGAGRPGGPGAGGDIESFLLSAQWREAVFTTHTRAANTLAQFRQLANAFAGVAGKKMVLWLTGDASPLNPTLMYQIVFSDPGSEPLRLEWREIAATFEALNVAGISVFPVDIRGIINPGLASAAEHTSHADIMHSLAESQPWESEAYPTTTSRRQGEAANAVLAMETAAVETGGRVLKGSNDLSELLGRAQGVWSSYYVLAFTPKPRGNGKGAAYHRIEVKVPGHPVQVLFRRGYVTRPESVIDSAEEIKRDMMDATASPVDLTALPLTLKLTPADHGPSGPGPRFLLSINGEALRRADTSQGPRYNFSIFILLKDSKGKVISTLGDKIDRVFTAAEAAGIVKTGFLYPGQFDAPAGERTFGRIIVRDNLSGHAGSITVEITQPSHPSR
jgi:VWFA-related protein